MIVATMLSSSNEAIAQDAARSVIKWVDAIVLIDTGINDDTRAKIQQICGEKLRCVSFAWKNDFAAARNFALQAAAEVGVRCRAGSCTKQVSHTYALTIDTDERLTFPGFKGRDDLEEMLELSPGVLTWFVPYQGGGYSKERFIRVPSKLRWEGRTHEALVGAMTQERRSLPGSYFVELPKTAEQYQHKLSRDLVILFEETRAKPTDARWWYYLGQTLEGLGRPREAAKAYRSCAQLNGWDEESAWASYCGALCLYGLKEYQAALEYCALGMSRHSGFPELPWLAGSCSHKMGKDIKAVYWEEMAIRLGNFEGVGAGEGRIFFRHLPAWYEAPYLVLGNCYRKLGKMREAELADEKRMMAVNKRERDTKHSNNRNSTSETGENAAAILSPPTESDNSHNAIAKVDGQIGEDHLGATSSTLATRQVVIGLGAGRCGTKSLAKILSACRNVLVHHEYKVTDWYRESDWVDGRDPRMKTLDDQDAYFHRKLSEGMTIGNVAFYLIPRWKRLRAKFPGCRIICLHRPKEETVESWLRWTEGKSQCYPPDLPLIALDPRVKHQAKWSPAFPKFEQARSSREAWEMHWDLCEREMALIDDAFHINTAELHSDSRLSEMFDYVGIPREDHVFLNKRVFNEGA